jgi:hypothetical protein
MREEAWEGSIAACMCVKNTPHPSRTRRPSNLEIVLLALLRVLLRRSGSWSNDPGPSVASTSNKQQFRGVGGRAAHIGRTEVGSPCWQSLRKRFAGCRVE